MAVAGLVLAGWTLLTAGKKEPMPTPLVEPPKSPYATTVAATGIIEAVNEMLSASGRRSLGLVAKVFVAVGDRVREGAPLLQLDDRDLRAQLVSREAAIPPAQAQVEEQHYRIGDLETHPKRLRAIHDNRAVSDDDVKRMVRQLEMASCTPCDSTPR
ncbi:MAG: biotin/lipoyl-binding protein [Nitrospiraceae bacterium]